MYFTPTTASRPILCMFGIEKMDGMNMLLLLPEIAVLVTSCVGLTMVTKAKEPPLSSIVQSSEGVTTHNLPSSGSYIHEENIRTMRRREFLVVFFSFLVCSVNPSLLTLPFLCFFLYCTLRWSIKSGSIHDSFVVAALPSERSKRVLLWILINIYATAYTLACYCYNLRGIPRIWSDDIIGIPKMRVFDGVQEFLVRYFPLGPLIPLVIISSLLWQADSKNIANNNKSRLLVPNGNDTANHGSILIELTEGRGSQDETAKSGANLEDDQSSHLKDAGANKRLATDITNKSTKNRGRALYTDGYKSCRHR